jgi:hypothetical protein
VTGVVRVETELAGVRRIGWRTLVPLGGDDLTELAPSPVDPQIATRAVRQLLRRGLVLMAVGLFGLIAAIVPGLVLNARAAALHTGGGQTPGIVVETKPGFWAFDGWISLRYTVDGVERVGEIALSGPVSRYQVGDQVTVYYDPADPERIRTQDDDNNPTWASIVLSAFLLVGFVLLPVGLAATLRWRGRARVVREHGWRPGRARVVRTVAESTLLDITLDGDPETIKVRTSLPVRFPVPNDLVESDVLLGGTGSRLVVTFQTGPFLMAAKPRGGH